MSSTATAGAITRGTLKNRLLDEPLGRLSELGDRSYGIIRQRWVDVDGSSRFLLCGDKIVGDRKIDACLVVEPYASVPLEFTYLERK